MKPSKRARVFIVLMLALSLAVLARLPSAMQRPVASATPQAVAWLVWQPIDPGMPQPQVNWNG